MNLSKLAHLDSMVLHAVCVECPDADIDSLCERTTLLLGEDAGFGAIGVVLTALEKKGLIRFEKRPEAGTEKVYVFPTQTGREKDKTYSVNQPDGHFRHSVPSFE